MGREMMHAVIVLEMLALALLAITCAACAHRSPLLAGRWTRIFLAALALNSMLSFGANLASMLGTASVSEDLLILVKSAEPLLISAILLIILSRCSRRELS